MKMDRQYYDESTYFGEHTERFTDLDTPFQKYRVAKVLQIYSPAKEDRVVDLGCGWGTFCFAVADLCKQVTGVDFSKKSIDLCRRILEERKPTNVDFLCADARDTGLEPESCDLIICADLFEHLYPDVSEGVLDECERLLRIGGKLVIWTPHRGHILEILKNNNIVLKRDVTHVDYKSMEGLLGSLRARGFLIRKSYYAESHIPVLRTFEKLLMGILPIMRRRIAILAEKK